MKKTTLSIICLLLGTILVLVKLVYSWERGNGWNKNTKVYTWAEDVQSWMSGAGLKTIPKDIPTEAIKVFLPYNQLKTIENASFSQLGSCEHLWLSGNKIQSIQKSAWNGLVRLKILQMDHNQIKVLQKDTFTGLPNCTKLLIAHNKIQEIQSGAFNDLLLVEKLELNNNDIEILKEGMFYGLPNCEVLYLYDNRIHSIEPGSWSGFDTLTEIQMFENGLTEIKPYMFNQLTQVEIAAWGKLRYIIHVTG